MILALNSGRNPVTVSRFYFAIFRATRGGALFSMLIAAKRNTQIITNRIVVKLPIVTLK
jgi:hypothetical protein